MSGRGRGYVNYGGRGGYSGRGSGYRGGYRGSGHRGSYEGRGGRGGYSYSNDNRYNSGGDRYISGRDRIEDSYKKSYRTESSSNYVGRDYGRSGSPDRKRMRMDGSGDRRSHDVGHYGGMYSNRQEGYSSERRSFGDDRRRSPSREGYRKSGGMPPPRSPGRGAPRSRISRAPRRSFRGRSLRSRGPYRGNVRSRGPYSRRIGERTYSYSGMYKPIKSLKGRSSIKSKGESASSTEEDWDADEKEVEREEKKEAKIKSPKMERVVGGEEEEEEVEEEDVGEDGGDTDKEGGDAASEDHDAITRRSAITGRPFIQLSCVHCKDKFITFSGYTKHLTSLRHRSALNSVARRLKAQLVRMRLAQRDAQRQLEAGQSEDLQAAATFCLVCRLKYRTTRHAHNLTDTHRAMKRFLLPYCRVCRITFRSPMAYEHHVCSLEHIKRKASQSARRPSPKAEGSGDEGMDVDLDNFMTLDSVGDVDEVDDDDSGGEKKEEAPPNKPKVEINIGREHIKKIEVWWCELCRVYLQRADTVEEERETLRRHCRLRAHLGRYVQHRDTRTLRKHAERIHRQLHQQKAEGEKEEASLENKGKEEKSVPAEEKKKAVENGTAPENSTGDDKMWADVDKDIGDLLREVDPQGNDGSDDEVDLGRYDKFRKSDKKLKIAGEEDIDEGVTEDVCEKAASEIDGTA